MAVEANSLSPEALYRQCDLSRFSFNTTEELEGPGEYVGQARALEALRFGTGIRQEGYHLYVMGPSGIGKHTMVRRYLEQVARQASSPSDWCYVNNFKQSHQPQALALPPGRGIKLQRDMKQLVEDLRSAIPVAFEAEEYHSQAQEIKTEVKEYRERAISELAQEAEAQGVTLLRTPSGFAFAPVKDGEVIGAEAYEKLSEEERKRIEQAIESLQEKLVAIIRREPKLQRQARDKLKALNREVAMYAVEALCDEMKNKYQDISPVLEYLETVQRDVIEHTGDFLRHEEGSEGSESDPFKRYAVNLLVDHSHADGAPVIYEDNPVYNDLVGRVEHLSHMGMLLTDFTLIKPGALHKANGGYLIVDALKVLTEPFAWEGLKRALLSKQIRIKSLGQIYSLMSTVSLEPQPIPLDIKVILLGERRIYYLLSQLDPEFSELFKVAADFEEEIDRSAEQDLLYARLIASQCRDKQLHPMDRHGVERVIEHGARLVGDAEKLSTHMHSLVRLLQEADYWACQDESEVIGREHVQRAIDEQIHRHDRLRQRIYEEIRRGTILIDTEGEKVGQVNGLSVLSLGNFAFAQSSRITATARLGDGDVVDIEREVKLGGAIHSKGVLILSSFLASRYASERPLSLSASLVFEQSYGMVDGDSASVGELCALLSVLANAPVRQSLAITGSVNQLGQVQAIGGVNEKIEGFYDICAGNGLTGQQGVIIPASNTKHLMLRRDVVEAVAAGRFHIYKVESVDQAIELLTGVPAGIADASGAFPEGCLNQRVARRLDELLELRQKYARRGKRKDDHD